MYPDIVRRCLIARSTVNDLVSAESASAVAKGAAFLTVATVAQLGIINAGRPHALHIPVGRLGCSTPAEAPRGTVVSPRGRSSRQQRRMSELKTDPLAMPAGRKSPAFDDSHLMRHRGVYRVMRDGVDA